MIRSTNDLLNLTISASDGTIGDVKDLYFDDEAWTIRYLVVSTSNWWLGHDVLVAPKWIQSVSWMDRTVAVDLTRDTLKQAPPYHSAVPLSHEMEIAVYKHYGRAAYWPGAGVAADRAAQPAVA